MPNNGRKPIVRILSETQPHPTAHQIGLKQVLLANDETESKLTQIAVTTLRKGEEVEPHVHKTMDEHYLFESGEGWFVLDGERIDCREGLFLLVPAGCEHSMVATTELKFMTIGVALD